MTTSSTPDIKKLYEEFGDQIDFIMLQVREAHPGELTPQPDSIEEKVKNAQSRTQSTLFPDRIEDYIEANQNISIPV